MLIEVNDIKLPIPSKHKELNHTKYFKKFEELFKRKFEGKFLLKKIMFKVNHMDPEISFLLFITKTPKELESLFAEEIKYIGFDFEETKGTILLTIVLAK